MKRYPASKSAGSARLVAAFSTLMTLFPGAVMAQTPPAFLPASYFYSGATPTRSAVVADVNADGKPDVIVTIFGNFRVEHGLVAVLPGNGDGTFGDPITYDSGGGAPFSLAVADVNGDGAPDIVVDNFCDSACVYSTAGVLINHGDGTFGPAVAWSLGGSSSNSIAIADVNEDGEPDLLAPVASSFGPAVAVLPGNGDGTFQPPAYTQLGQWGAVSIAVADINRDAHPDVAVAGFEISSGVSRGSLTILLGNGDGTFQPPLATYDTGGSAGGWANSVVIADLNADGAPDLAVANYPTAPRACSLATVMAVFGPSCRTTWERL